MAQFSEAPQSGPLLSSSSSTSPASIAVSSPSPSTSARSTPHATASPSGRASIASSARPLCSAVPLVGLDEPWASGQRKRYLNSLQTSELAA